MRDVRFGFGPDRFALSVPTLDIDAGHTVACIGPSGSGKSTLLLLLAGILLPQQGSVAISGVDWGRNMGPKRSKPGKRTPRRSASTMPSRSALGSPSPTSRSWRR